VLTSLQCAKVLQNNEFLPFVESPRALLSPLPDSINYHRQIPKPCILSMLRMITKASVSRIKVLKRAVSHWGCTLASTNLLIFRRLVVFLLIGVPDRPQDGSFCALVHCNSLIFG